MPHPHGQSLGADLPGVFLRVNIRHPHVAARLPVQHDHSQGEWLQLELS